MDLEQGMQLDDLWAIVRRRWRLAAGVAGAVFLASILLAALLPNTYEAAATLLVEPQTISKNLVDAGVEATDLNSRLHLMHMEILSRSRLSRVIDELNLYQEESQQMTREQVVEMMRGQISLVPVLPDLEVDPRDLQINTLQIVFRADRPRTAAEVANRLANDFIEEHIRERVRISGDTSEFIDAELERIAARTRQVETQIAEIKSANTGRLPEDMDSNQRRLERALSDLRAAQNQVAIARSDEAFYRQQALTGSDARNSFAQPDSPSERLQRLQLHLNELEARGFTEKHPDVIIVREEIAALEAQIEEGAAGLEADEGSYTPTQQLSINEADRAGIRAEAAQRDVDRMMAQVEQFEERLAVTPQVAEQLSLLESERTHLRESFAEFSSKRLEAGVASDMERRQKGEQFRLLDAAVPPLFHSSPKRLVIVAVGLLFGLALGGGLALLLEVTDPSFHEARPAQEGLGLPVLASVPRIVLASDRAAAQRRRLITAVLVAGVSGVVLIGAGAGYWAVNGPPGIVKALLPDDAGSGGAAPEPSGQ